VPPETPVVLTFNQPMTPSSLTAQTTSGACTGAIQVSTTPAFASCVGFSTSSATVSALNSVATLRTTAPLVTSGHYYVRATAPAASPNGNAVAAPGLTQAAGFDVSPCSSNAVVISQFYGGGGNTGAQFHNDYVELHNRSSQPVTLDGWSIQYNSAAGTFPWLVTPLPTGASALTIAPGGYLLIQEAAGTGAGAALPTPDFAPTGPAVINMAATNGRLALVNNSTAMTAACPTPGAVVDFVGYGGTAICSENGTAPVLTNITAGFRGGTGCNDTNVNSADFTTAAPAPNNSASATLTCTCP